MKIDFKITEILTLPITIMAAISLASSILLFSPNSFLTKLFMLEFREQYGFIVGIVFLISISILIVNLIYTISKSTIAAKSRRDFYANAEKNLRGLSDYQKTIVYVLFQEDNRTADLPIHDGAVAELSQMKVIGHVSKQYMVADFNTAAIPYLLQPWVAQELKKKPDLSFEFKNAFEMQLKKELSARGERDTSW